MSFNVVSISVVSPLVRIIGFGNFPINNINFKLNFQGE